MLSTSLLRRICLAGHAGLVLLDPNDDTGGGSNPPAPAPNDQGSDDGSTDHDDDAVGGAGASKTFSQADVDAIVSKRVKAEQAKLANDLKTLKDRGDLDEAERLRAELADRDKAVEAAERKVLENSLSTTAERLALAAGVNPAKVTKFLRTFDLDLDELTTDGKVDTDAVKALVEKEAADSPEYQTTGSGAPAPTGGDMSQGTGGAKVWTREEIDGLSPAEFKKNEPEIMAQMRAGTIK